MTVRGDSVMITPRKVRVEARKKEDENLEFRSVLKFEADEKELDEKFVRLHNELFLGYDCDKCRNCCKMYYGCIPNQDIAKNSEMLGMSADEFVKRYLAEQDEEGNYQTKHRPCDFLNKDGSCKLGECKPESCKKFPYTDQPNRILSLYSVLEAVSVCPVAFEIYERLKKEYGFRKK